VRQKVCSLLDGAHGLLVQDMFRCRRTDRVNSHSNDAVGGASRANANDSEWTLSTDTSFGSSGGCSIRRVGSNDHVDDQSIVYIGKFV
jgi:hypothetical protein